MLCACLAASCPENKRKSSAPDDGAGGPPPGVEDDTGAASGLGGGVGHAAKPKEEEPPAPPQLLTERDLERSVYLSLTETDTIFIMQVAGESRGGRVHAYSCVRAAHARAGL